MNFTDVELHLDADLASTKNLTEIQNLQIKYLGRKGIINKLLDNLSKLSTEQKKKQGKAINDFKSLIENKIKLRQKLILHTSFESEIDLTLPGKKRQIGSLHIVTLAIEEIVRIFKTLGFIRMSYPEVDWEYFAFESLNMPVNHPARDDFESFFIDFPRHAKYGRLLLTPHTSSGQVREMKRVKTPPIKMINIARTYRPNWDASHTPMFHQFEGLCIDKNINITNLKGTIDYFVHEFFGEDREIRLRPFHFQFTEPSFEVDISCSVCNGTGNVKNIKCKLCKSGWLELGGAGMVHPFVLKSGGIDPVGYSGFAFGFGVERVMMMKSGLKLDDIRILYAGDIRFLEQF